MSRLRILANREQVGFLEVTEGRWSFEYDAGWKAYEKKSLPMV